MANDLVAETGGRALAAADGNPWAEAARGVETGTYLKFNGNDGRWSFGQDDEDLPDGSRVVVDMQTLAFGFICWTEGSVEEEVLVPVLDGKPPLEEDLTDYGPYDDDDGWREASSLSMILESYGDDDQDEAVGTSLLWKTSTGGQVRQIRKLSGAFGRVFSQHPDEYPIVELGEESYAPRNKKHGKKKHSPILKIVGWMTAAELEGLTGVPLDDEDEEDEKAALPAPKKGKAKPKKAAEPEVEEDEEEEEKPVRRRKKAPEPEPEEDEEEEKPARRRRKAAPEPEEEDEEEEEKPARRRRKAAPEPEEEDEEEEEKPARRRRKAAPEPEEEEDEDEGDEAPAPKPRGRSAGRANKRLRNFD